VYKPFGKCVRLVLAIIHGKLVSFGKPVVPLLETEWGLSGRFHIQERIEVIIDEIEFENGKVALQSWASGDTSNLLEGTLIANSFQYPYSDRNNILDVIEKLRKDVWIELNENLTSLEKVRVINHMIYDVHHFKAHSKHHDSHHSYFVNYLFDHLKGSPIALGILYKHLADLLGLPIVGLNLPYHFILGYRDVHNDTDNEMLFYINPFSKGAVFGRGELERYIEKAGIDMHFSELKPMSNIQIIKRMLNEMKACYQRIGKYQKLDQANALAQLLSKGNI
jgi:regulator of sirC expression with transglutaminase-like and TPR domain